MRHAKFQILFLSYISVRPCASNGDGLCGRGIRTPLVYAFYLVLDILAINLLT